MLVTFLVIWALSPIVLIPLTIWAIMSRKKLERFIGQLLFEKRISSYEYSMKATEKKPSADSLPKPYYPAGEAGAPKEQTQVFGTFIGPPIPPELLLKRREEAERMAAPDAVRDVSLRIAETAPEQPALALPSAEPAAEISLEKPAQPAEEIAAETAPARAEAVQPAEEIAAETAPAQAEAIKPAEEIAAETAPARAEAIKSAEELAAETAPAQAESVQPAAGVFGSFIGPPIPPEIIAQRRAMSAASAAQPQPVRDGRQGNMPPLPAHAKKKRTINPASAMLIIGSALVVIAGMIFSTAKWNDMSNWQRTGVIAVMAAFFFGLSAVAHKKLRLENTGMAFYMLGSVFTAITFVTIGYFGLLGSWLAVKGGGFWLLYSLAALLVTIFSAGAVRLYKKGAFVNAALYGGLCSFTLMSVQLFNGSPDMWALFLNLIAALPIFLLYKQKLRFGSEMYDDQLKLFTAVLGVIYFVAALPYMIMNLDGGWTVPCFLTMLVWTAQTAAYGILLDSRLLKHIHPILVTITLTELALSIPGIGSETRLLIFGAGIFAAAAVYRYIGRIRTAFSDILFPAVLLFSLFVPNSAAREGGQFAVCTGLLMGIFLMQSVTKNKTDVSRAFTAFLPVSVLIADFGITDLIDYNTAAYNAVLYFIFASVAFAAALVFTFVKPVRTVLSDAVFPTALLVCYSLGASAMHHESYCTVMTFLTAVFLLANVLIHALEDPAKRMVKPYAYILPFAAALFGQGAAVLVNDFSERNDGSELAFAFGCAFFVCAVAMRFVPRLRTLFSDVFNIAVMGAAVLVCREYGAEPFEYRFAAYLAVLLTVLIAMQCFDKGRERSPILFRGLLSASSVWLAVTISSALTRTLALPAYDTRQQLAVLAFILPVFAAAFIFMNVERIKSGVSALIFPVALMCGGIAFCDIGDAGSYLLGAVGFALMAVIMLIQNSEKGMAVDALRYFLWAPFAGIAISLALAISTKAANGADGCTFLCAGLLIVLFGLAFRYSVRLGADFRTILSDIFFTASAVFLAVIGFSEKPIYGLFVSFAAALLVLANITERKPKYSWFVLGSRWLLPCVLTLFAVSAAGSVADAAEDKNLFWQYEASLPENLTFIILMLAIAAVFLKIRKIRTVFSDFFIPAALGVICISEMDGARIDLLISMLTSMTVICVILLMYGLEKDGESHLVVHRMAAPLALFAAADRLAALINWFEGMPKGFDVAAAFLACAVIAAAAAAVFTSAAKSGGEKRFTQSQYAWGALAGALLIPAGFERAPSAAGFALGICAVLMGAAVYLLCGRQKRNWFGVIPVIAMLTASGTLADQIAFLSKSGLAGTDRSDELMIVSAVLFIVFCALSRLVNRDSALVRGEERTAVDFAAFAMLAAPFITIGGGSAISDSWCRFIAVLEFGLFFLNLIRKDHDRRTNLVMLTLASAAGCALIYFRPFLLTDNEALAAKINLIPLILFSILVRVIWKEEKKLASDISFVVQLAAFAVLLFDALTHQSLANTIIVLCVTLTIMLVSFAMKSGRWFAISAASFLGLTIYITRGFVSRVEWWVYLLTAGLILIAVASVNEYMKSRGQTLKDAGKHFLSRWKK